MHCLRFCRPILRHVLAAHCVLRLKSRNTSPLRGIFIFAGALAANSLKNAGFKRPVFINPQALAKMGLAICRTPCKAKAKSMHAMQNKTFNPPHLGKAKIYNQIITYSKTMVKAKYLARSTTARLKQPASRHLQSQSLTHTCA